MCGKKHIVKSVIGLLLAFSILCSISVSVSAEETIQPRASEYLSVYGAYVYYAGYGLIQVYFNAQGTGHEDELGALSIQIYECSTNSSNINDWEWKATFTHDTTPGMLSYNDDYHSGHVDYPDGKPGWWYKAYVCIWGGKDDDGDTRYFWTSAKQAT